MNIKIDKSKILLEFSSVGSVASAVPIAAASPSKSNKITQIVDKYPKGKQESIEEASRWKKEAALGNISKSGIKDIKGRGIAKSDSELAKGMNTGTNNILKKESPNTKIIDQKISLKDTSKTGGFMTNGQGNIVHQSDAGFFKRLMSPGMKAVQITKKQKDHNELARAMNLRHEAYEAGAVNKAKNKFGEAAFQNGIAPGTMDGRFLKEKYVNNKNLSGGQVAAHSAVGNHMSGNILNREAKDISDLSYTGVSQKLKNLRNRSGEYDAIKKDTGVDLNKRVHSRNVGNNAARILNHENQRRARADKIANFQRVHGHDQDAQLKFLNNNLAYHTK